MKYPVDLPRRHRLLRLFDYEPETGLLRWRERPSSRRAARSIAGVKKKRDGVVQVCIDGRAYRAHRLIWKMVYGDEPSEIDHINGDPSDNRIANLRATDRAGNSQNRRACKSNKLGVKGVYETYWGRFCVQVTEEARKAVLLPVPKVRGG